MVNDKSECKHWHRPTEILKCLISCIFWLCLFTFVEIFVSFFPNIKFWYGITPIQFEGRVIQILLCCIMELVLFLVPFHHKYLEKKLVIFVTLCVQILYVIRDFRGLSSDIWPVRRQNFYYKWYGTDPHCKSLEYNRLAFKILSCNDFSWPKESSFYCIYYGLIFRCSQNNHLKWNRRYNLYFSFI